MTERRTRRTPEEVRALVLLAAHELFAEQGYHGTKTREIAERAGVAEPVIFRHFGSKAEIFEVAIVAPFNTFAEKWAESWRVEPLAAADEYRLTRTFVEGFYDLTLEHRDVLRTLMAARTLGTDAALTEAAERVAARLADLYRLVRTLLVEHRDARGWDELDPPMTVAVAFGAIVAVVLFDEWVFPADERLPDRERQVEELTQMLLNGVANR